MRQFHPAQAIAERPLIHLERALAPGHRGVEILDLDELGVGLNERIRILREAATSRQQQPFVLGDLDEERLNRLEREGHGITDEVGIFVRREAVAARGERVRQPVDGEFLDRAPRAHRGRERQYEQAPTLLRHATSDFTADRGQNASRAGTSPANLRG